MRSDDGGLPPLLGQSLCARCRHVKRVDSARGSTFLSCGRSRTEPDFPKYPPQPVARCTGFEE